MKYFKTFDKPRNSDTHTYADFAELLCLTDIDNESGTEAVRDQIFDLADYQLTEDKLSDIIAQMKWRSEAFGDYYPFKVTRNNFNCSSTLTDKQKLYCALLFCSNLPFIEKGSHKTLTDTFEDIAKTALSTIWHPLGEVVSFGKNLTNYIGDKHERLNTLFMNIGNSANFKKNDFRKGDSGDGGIDLAAWIQLDSYQHSHTFSALAQCACSRTDWVTKQHEIKCDTFSPFTPISSKWSELLFTPICFRGNNGEWAAASDVHAGVFFDRLRIINQIKVNPIVLPDLFDKLLEQKRDLTS